MEHTSQEHRSMSFSPMGVMEKYEGVGDYTLWKESLFSHLETMGLMDVLKEKERMEAALVKGAAKVVSSRSEGTSEAHKEDPLLSQKEKKARSVIILSVGDHILRKIMKEKTAACMIQVLDKLYMSKLLSRCLYLKKKLYGYKRNEKVPLDENINEFLDIVLELDKLEVIVSDKVKAVFLLMSLPSRFSQLKDTLEYCEGPLSLGKVMTAVYMKECEFRQIEEHTN